MNYPVTRKDSTIDHYFGTPVPDPFRWLEDDRAEETAAWVAAQNVATNAYLDQVPFRNEIKDRLLQLWNYEKFGTPFRAGDWTYFFKNDGLQNQAVLYRQAEGQQLEVFLDPNTFSTAGTSSLGGINFSKDGSLAAYQVSEGGSDWRTVYVMRTSDKALLDDVLLDVKFTEMAWKGNEGFYYSSYPPPQSGSALSGMTDQHQLFYHRLGTPQVADELVFGGAETPRRYIWGYLTENERYLVISAANSTTGNELYLRDLTVENAPLIPVVTGFDHEHSVIDEHEGRLFLLTNLDAPNYRVVTAEARSPQVSGWTDLIPESEDVLNISTGAGKLFACYLRDAVSVVWQFDRNGHKEREIALPGPGTAGGFSAREEDRELYYTFTSYVYPTTIFKYDPVKGKSVVFKKAGVAFDPERYQSRQVFYRSKDGTRIPMIITSRKDLPLNGNHPLLLYGYGGFGVNLTPAFSTSNIVLLEQGGVYAVPNLRGGGEYGEAWHLAGTRMNKQNVFDDFIAAAEYLIEHGYTSANRLAISGGSNGGLLVGAVMAQRPELFRAAFPAVGVLDMLRYHQFTAGAGWAYDYGTAQDSREQFDYLLGYSPYHALREGTAYPATLVTTGDHDDRVVPAHSFKFAARLQECQGGEAPVLIRIDTKAGHGAGKSTAQVIDEQADKWTFFFQQLNWDWDPTEE